MSQTSPCPNCGVVHPFGNENCPKAEMRTFPVPAPEVETRPAGQPLHLVAPQTAIGAEDDGYDLLRLRVTDADLPFTAGCRALLDRLLRDNFTRVVNERHPNIGDEIAKLTLLEKRASAIFVDSRDINASGLSLRAYLDRHFDAASQGASGPEERQS